MPEPFPDPVPPTYLTADVPGTGGVIRERQEDFLVEEQPLYEPSGEGEHLYLYIEKKSLTTHDAVRRVARAFRVGKGDVGYAGLKDKHGITRQHLSVYLPDRGLDSEGLAVLSGNDYLKVLWAERHTNKLRRGHHGGNRFVIRIRQVDPTGVRHAKAVLDRLAAVGAPNVFGPQRFGFRMNTHLLGRALLLGEHDRLLERMLGEAGDEEREELRAARAAYLAGDLERALERWPRNLRFDRQALDGLRQGKSAADVVHKCIERSQRTFMLSALQSALFNRVVADRIERGWYDRLVPGDLAWKHDSRAVFAVNEATAEIENAADGRVAKLEVSPSGPMWGVSMTRPEGEPAAVEAAALAAYGLEPADLERERRGLEGGRRSLRVRLTDPDLSGGVDEHGSYIRLAFELPRGAYATTVLGEVMKKRVI